MKWSSNTKKRRRERKLLEVKARTRRARVERLRLVSAALTVSFGTIVVLFFLWRGGEWGLNRVLYANDAFALQRIQIVTDGVLPANQIRHWSQVKPGDNLLSLDLGQVKQDLEWIPWIRRVTVERVLPHTLKLTVTERRPVAQVRALETRAQSKASRMVSYFLDRSGQVMLPLSGLRLTPALQQHWRALPTLTGVDLSEMRPGRPITAGPVQAALRLLGEFERSSLKGLVRIAFVEVADPPTLEVTTASGAEITLATNDFAGQLRRWKAIYDVGQRAGWRLRTLDLSVTNNIPAHWLEARHPPAGERRELGTKNV